MQVKCVDMECTPTVTLAAMNKTLSIREVAALTGLSPDTLRYYERIGLIDTVPRSQGDQRLYGPELLRWVEFLVKLRVTGLSIKQMQSYAESRRQGNSLESIEQRLGLLQVHADKVADQIQELQKNLGFIQEKIAVYHQMRLSVTISEKQEYDDE